MWLRAVATGRTATSPGPTGGSAISPSRSVPGDSSRIQARMGAVLDDAGEGAGLQAQRQVAGLALRLAVEPDRSAGCQLQLHGGAPRHADLGVGYVAARGKAAPGLEPVDERQVGGC